MSHQPPVPKSQQAPFPGSAEDHERTAERDELVAETKAKAEEQAAEAESRRRVRTGVGVGVGLGIGSAAIVAALLYAKGGKAAEKGHKSGKGKNKR